MFDTVVIATDGSESGRRAVDCALDLAARFDAAVHALYVVDEDRVAGLPEQVQGEVREAFTDEGEAALDAVTEAAERDVTRAVRAGDPAEEICRYVDAVDADVVATGTRGRDGAHSFLVGSVAEAVVRVCPAPVLTVRQREAA